MALLIEGLFDWRLADNLQTRVSQAQADVLLAQEAVEAGATEVRFGDQLGELLANLADGRWVEIGVDGSIEDVTEEVMG